MKNRYLYRDYQNGDFAQIETVWKSTGMGGSHRSDTAQVIETTINGGGKLFVIEDVETETIIGTSWLTNDKQRIYLHHFGILPEYQGKGLSKELLKLSLEFVKAQNLQIKLEVGRNNLRALNLYKKYGFEYLGDYDVYIIREIEKINLES